MKNHDPLVRNQSLKLEGAAPVFVLPTMSTEPCWYDKHFKLAVTRKNSAGIFITHCDGFAITQDHVLALQSGSHTV